MALQFPAGTSGATYVGGNGVTYTFDATAGVWTAAASGGGSSGWTTGAGVIYPTAATDDVLVGGTLPGTPALRLADSGLITLGGTAPGIQFPPVAVASADPNTLDDYEEGTWTPTLGGGFTFTGANGFYTKIGNLVTGGFTAFCPAMASGTGASIGGLPFAPNPATQNSGGFMVQTNYGSSNIMFKTVAADFVTKDYTNSNITYTQLSNKDLTVAFFYYV